MFVQFVSGPKSLADYLEISTGFFREILVKKELTVEDRLAVLGGLSALELAEKRLSEGDDWLAIMLLMSDIDRAKKLIENHNMSDEDMSTMCQGLVVLEMLLDDVTPKE